MGGPARAKLWRGKVARVWARGIGDFARVRREPWAGGTRSEPGLVLWQLNATAERLESNVGQNRVTKPKMSTGFSLISTYFRIFPLIPENPREPQSGPVVPADLGSRRPGKLRSI